MTSPEITYAFRIYSKLIQRPDLSNLIGMLFWDQQNMLTGKHITILNIGSYPSLKCWADGLQRSRVCYTPNLSDTKHLWYIDSHTDIKYWSPLSKISVAFEKLLLSRYFPKGFMGVFQFFTSETFITLAWAYRKNSNCYLGNCCNTLR